jgi:hypothetical protein
LKARRQNADDRDDLFVERQRSAEDRRVRTKAFAPHLVAEHHDATRSPEQIAGLDQATDHRFHAQRAKHSW